MPHVIIVGVDESPMSELALQEALKQASQDGQLHVVHCVEEGPLADRAPHSTDDPSTPPDHRQEMLSFINRTNTADAPLELHVLFGGPPQDLLCDLASKLDADLLVVGAQGARGYSRMWIGSCADNVLRNAPCSVLVVRPKPRPATGAPSIGQKTSA